MFQKPNVVISKCIEFDHCRYDGAIIRSEQVAELKPFVNFIPICPEYEIHLGVPRGPIRLVKQGTDIHLIQPATDKILTTEMNQFASSFFHNLPDIDGFILKSRSPSCGISDVRIYSSIQKGPAIGKTSGIFGGIVKDTYQDCAIEDEGRLRNPRIREHFLRRIFTLASFRLMKNKKSIQSLIEFHTTNKFLFMSYHQKNLEMMGRIVSNPNHDAIETILTNYGTVLKETFQKAPSCTRNINVLQHIFGFFSKNLSKEERTYFIDTIKLYRNGQLSLAAITRILESWAIRFNETYLLNQTFFNPYPKELIHIENIDSCHARNYWK